MKKLKKQNPVIFENCPKPESQNMSNMLMFDELTGEIYDRNPNLFTTGGYLPSLVQSELIFKDGILSVKNAEDYLKEENEEINASFHDKKMKIKINDLDAAIAAGFVASYLSIKENTNIIIEKLPEQIIEDKVIMSYNLYLNNIKSSDLGLFAGAVEAGIFETPEMNPTKI